MFVLLGIVLGFAYIIQPLDILRAPVDWMNATLVTHTGTLMDWLLGGVGDSEGKTLLALLVAVATPGIAGLALNLVAPLARTGRIVFSVLMVLLSLGAFGTLPWYQAIALSAVTTVVGAILAIASGPIIEALAAFFSVTLGFSQVRMLLFDYPSPKLQQLMDYMATQFTGSSPDMIRFICAAVALVPTGLIIAWLVWRFTPTSAAE